MPGLTSAYIILSSLLPRCSVTLHIVLGMFDGNRNGGVAARRPRAPSPWRYPLLYRCARVLIQRRSLSLRVRGQCCAVYVSAPTSHTRSLRHLSVLSPRFSPTVSPTRSLDSLPLISSLIFVIARRSCRRHGAVAPFPSSRCLQSKVGELLLARGHFQQALARSSMGDRRSKEGPIARLGWIRSKYAIILSSGIQASHEIGRKNVRHAGARTPFDTAWEEECKGRSINEGLENLALTRGRG